MGPTWGPTGSCRIKVGLMLARRTLLQVRLCVRLYTVASRLKIYCCRFFSRERLASARRPQAAWLNPQVLFLIHYNDVIMGAITSQITSLTIVYSIFYSDADQRKHQSSASLAFVRGIYRGPVNSPHKWSVTRKMFPFDYVIMQWRWVALVFLSLFPGEFVTWRWNALQSSTHEHFAVPPT